MSKQHSAMQSLVQGTAELLSRLHLRPPGEFSDKIGVETRSSPHPASLYFLFLFSSRVGAAHVA